MKNIMLFEQWKELYANYLMIRPVLRQRDYIYKGGDLNVTVTANKRDNRQITAGH